MAANDARTVNQFRRLTAEPEENARLLERFFAHTDAAAFSELVRRHGPMVSVVRVLELRVQQLEREVRELRSLVEELRKPKP
ncbi:hypothetical protein J8F10_29420 [Gemmata sp. G18]|uniref:Uncharacterized protein n=1 Tax=Gemmata palustris TaxID=2822762 RepID=A0ABS5C2M1_9BACT|nr:hypothetical protein [Gemmata palustris]MBP3959383.1 hypothetical protein [Gemmata palustris]